MLGLYIVALVAADKMGRAVFDHHLPGVLVVPILHHVEILLVSPNFPLTSDGRGCLYTPLKP
jgi:hypothetical protein